MSFKISYPISSLSLNVLFALLCGSQPWADGYWFCDFEADLCGWDLRTPSPLKWKVLGQANISLSDPLRGPGRDHSTNTASGVKNLMRSLST